jgi:hypothetical protein
MQYSEDYEGIGRYLRESQELRTELHRRAEMGLNIARALAPVLNHATHDRVPGALKASGHVTDDGLDDIHHDRMQLSIVFDPDPGYGAAATFPHRHPNPSARDYLTAAIPIIERG